MVGLTLHDETPLGRARSSYADMLHDDERNHAYNTAIKATVHHLVKSLELNPTGARFYNCCDVGLGSGLLSMMIVRAFRELNYPHFHVTGFEEYPPMAECAGKIIKANNMQRYITIVGKRVQEVVEVPKFDLLVAELLDTELIGENCLDAYEHAKSRLCSTECKFIPDEATIHIQLISSRYLCSRQILDDIPLSFVEVKMREDVKNCSGLSDIDDLQMHNIPDLIELSEPKEVFRFKFGDITKSKFREEQVVSVELTKDIPSVPLVLMWWDIKMYDESQYQMYLKDTTKDHNLECKDKLDLSFDTLSCAPSWVRENPEYIGHYYKERDDYVARLYGRDVWREHWMRGVYTIGKVAEAKKLVGQRKGSLLQIYAYHDTVSLWFELQPSSSRYPRTCTCGVHRLLSRAELGFLSDFELDGDLQVLSECVANNMGEWCRGPVCGSAIDLKRGELCIYETEPKNGRGIKWYVEYYTGYEDDCLGSDYGLRDHHLHDDVPWLCLYNSMRRDENIEPFDQIQIYCSQVVFKNLSRICDRVGTCQGFDLSHLDDEIRDNSSRADNSVDSLFLWEYHCDQIVGGTTSIHEVSFADPDFISDWSVRKIIELPSLSSPGRALVFWATFGSNGYKVISTGPRDFCTTNEVTSPIKWNRNYKQLVYFLHDELGACGGSKITVEIELDERGLRVRRTSG